MTEMKMIDHQKLILENSVHDKAMFQKELIKSLKWLGSEELNELYNWLRANYWTSHKDIIKEVFERVAA
ncbi:MAG: hypothetical protein JW894_12945 [Bacteroidales bacterium]|nr:hypothetical protein [Bacteroidales bacterium]